jgi:hypothetical protein
MRFPTSAIIMVTTGEKYSTDLSKNVTNPAHINIAPTAYKSEVLFLVNFMLFISSI